MPNRADAPSMDEFPPTDFTDGFLVERHRARGGRPASEVAHYHGHYEVYLSLGEGVTFLIGRTVHTVRHHDILFIPPFTAHRAVYRPSALRDRIHIAPGGYFARSAASNTTTSAPGCARRT